MATEKNRRRRRRRSRGGLNPESIRKQIKMPPELQEAYDRVVLAGMKVLFSKESHQLLMDEIQGQGPVPQRLGEGVAGLMLLLFKESNQTIPPQVIVPAGTELMMQVADFLKKTGLMPVSDQDVGAAMEIMIMKILQAFGVDPMQMQQMLNQYDNTKVDAAAQQMGGQS